MTKEMGARKVVEALEDTDGPEFDPDLDPRWEVDLLLTVQATSEQDALDKAMRFREALGFGSFNPTNALGALDFVWVLDAFPEPWAKEVLTVEGDLVGGE